MATIIIQPSEGNYQINVHIELRFEAAEIGKEFLLKGSVKVFEGRLTLLSTLELNEIKVKPSNVNPIQLTQQFPLPHHGFQLQFESDHSLYMKV